MCLAPARCRPSRLPPSDTPAHAAHRPPPCPRLRPLSLRLACVVPTPVRVAGGRWRCETERDGPRRTLRGTSLRKEMQMALRRSGVRGSAPARSPPRRSSQKKITRHIFRPPRGAAPESGPDALSEPRLWAASTTPACQPARGPLLGAVEAVRPGRHGRPQNQHSCGVVRSQCRSSDGRRGSRHVPLSPMGTAGPASPQYASRSEHRVVSCTVGRLEQRPSYDAARAPSEAHVATSCRVPRGFPSGQTCTVLLG